MRTLLNKIPSKATLNHIMLVFVVLLIVPLFLYEDNLVSARPHLRRHRNKMRKTLSDKKFKESSNPFQGFSFINAKQGDIIKWPPVQTELIKSHDISKQEMSQLLSPPGFDLILSSPYKQWRGGGSRKIRLYCRVGKGFHLEIRDDGKIIGQHKPTKYSWLKRFSLDNGVVGFKGIHSERYLCMNKKGKLTGEIGLGPHCRFREVVEANNFNTYSSITTTKNNKHLYLALNKNGIPKRGRKIPRSPNPKTAHWLPRIPNPKRIN